MDFMVLTRGGHSGDELDMLFRFRIFLRLRHLKWYDMLIYSVF